MNSISILNIESSSYSKEASKICENIGQYNEVNIERTEVLSIIDRYDVLITRLGYRIDSEFFDAADNLKVIVTATTGLDHIDLDMALKNNVEVLSLKGEADYLSSVTATSELAWGLLLSVVRYIPHAHNAVNKAEWCRDKFKGWQLSGKTLGIIGLGRLGKHMARYGNSFGMNVIAYDPYLEDWPSDVKRIDKLNDIFLEASVISLHVPLNKSTQKLITKEQFGLLTGNTVFINTSRGDIVDENHLLDALTAGKLSGAGLDVISNESEFDDKNALLVYARENDNLIMTPHIGGLTSESMESTEIFMAKKLEKHIANMKY